MVSTVTGAVHRHPDPTADLVDSGVVSPFALVKTSLRCEYDGTDVLLARMASDGRLSVEQLVDLAARRPAAGEVPEGLSAPAVSALAFWTVGRSLEDGAIRRAADLFDLARLLARRAGRTPEHPDLDLQVSLAAGRLDDPAVKARLGTPGLDPWVAWAVRADRANPFPAADPAALDAWYEIFDEPFVARGISPVRVGDVATPFPSLTTTHGGGDAGSVDGPLVSIVVPVYADGDDLLTAIGSLVRQTWRNLQIILVDDASPEEHRHVFDAALALDPRVEYVRMPVNGGAYKARNAGIARARGEVVGIQDADDWSHPERIARQMALMTAEPGLMATLSKAIRLHSDLRITKVGSLPFERNLPSLLFRREAVLARLGRFDDVRKAADTEFVARIAAAYGPEAVRTLEEPLALYQLTDGSLSREDFRIGWHRHTRVSYHAAYRHWHRQIAAGTADPRLDDTTGRRFPAPPELEGVPHPTRLDVVVMADTRGGGTSGAGIADELRALAGSGVSVGVSRTEPLRLGTVNRGYPAPAVADLVADGTVVWSPLVATTGTDLLVVRDPDLVTAPRTPGTVNLRPDRVVVVADRVPAPEGGRRLSYDPRRVEESVRELFGLTPEWLPATAQVAEAVTGSGVHGLVHPPRPAEVLEVARHPYRPVLGRPVIGAADDSRFAAERLGPRVLQGVLPEDDAHDVRLLTPGGRRLSRHWLSFDPAQVSHAELFDQCDIVVAPAPPIAGPTLVRPVLEAMSRGCVPVADPVHRPVLGDAAVYLDGRPVAQVVDELWADPETFHARQQAALAFCRERLSAEGFTTAITQIRSTHP